MGIMHYAAPCSGIPTNGLPSSIYLVLVDIYGALSLPLLPSPAKYVYHSRSDFRDRLRLRHRPRESLNPLSSWRQPLPDQYPTRGPHQRRQDIKATCCPTAFTFATPLPGQILAMRPTLGNPRK